MDSLHRQLMIRQILFVRSGRHSSGHRQRHIQCNYRRHPLFLWLQAASAKFTIFMQSIARSQHSPFTTLNAELFRLFSENKHISAQCSLCFRSNGMSSKCQHDSTRSKTGLPESRAVSSATSMQCQWHRVQGNDFQFEKKYDPKELQVVPSGQTSMPD